MRLGSISLDWIISDDRWNFDLSCMHNNQHYIVNNDPLWLPLYMPIKLQKLRFSASAMDNIIFVCETGLNKISKFAKSRTCYIKAMLSALKCICDLKYSNNFCLSSNGFRIPLEKWSRASELPFSITAYIFIALSLFSLSMFYSWNLYAMTIFIFLMPSLFL